ncbi:tRNA (guanine(37)-N1)-methyltransferase [Wallemia ichthyophaga EXF-994]|uniref:tRNA (guanine(37)-N1)-methyltransferase n=1 Tax=Wallemia ichthyophaga (strain EXF-994 / CBS 113033) TaxID=1299270 RepID=R9APJ6_WALI9|nr:tRNA (guanine(37)-N1)-methyltransferase [Wallemia ichthyophaga EXF-994]EOR04144.1 tRNA (guanine(37)-N1)-methyltransferase [Wallemia ichthyophaga EXF-994]
MLRNLSLKSTRQFSGVRCQSTLPSLTNLNASWNTLSTEEKQAVYTGIVERQKLNWNELSLEEKRAAYFISFGSHGPRKALVEEGGNTKVFVGVVASLAATAALYFGIRSFAAPPPQTMSKEWQEASTEYMREQNSNPISGVSSEGYKDGTPSGFTQTGHLAHFNLKPEFNTYKHLIGQVILDKNQNIDTVVNKLDTIDNQFRVFPMELLAGAPNYIVTTKESDSVFTFDFSKVYWNSRLSTEHSRIINLFKPFQVVADVMAGVGPFAIPSGRNSTRFLANDLNPDSFHWLKHNIKQNKVDSFVRPSNLDGREFIKSAHKSLKSNPFPETTPILTQKQQKELKRSVTQFPTHPPQDYIDHYVMNLPATAIEFLDAFKPTYTEIQQQNKHNQQALSLTRPMVHVHCFSKAEDKQLATAEICERATNALDHPITPDIDDYNLHHVRSVAPNKEMYCLSFRIPQFV